MRKLSRIALIVIDNIYIRMFQNSAYIVSNISTRNNTSLIFPYIGFYIHSLTKLHGNYYICYVQEKWHTYMVYAKLMSNLF